MTTKEMSPDDDIFSSGAEAIVNPVNCFGISGKGLALKFKEDFPENFKRYKLYCDEKLLQPGGLFFTKEPMDGSPEGQVFIVNMATKDHWRDASKISWLETGVKNLRMWAEEFGVKSIACPAIGSGLGGLPWTSVREILIEEFRSSNVEVLLHPPKDGPAYTGKRSNFRP